MRLRNPRCVTPLFIIETMLKCNALLGLLRCEFQMLTVINRYRAVRFI